MNPTVLVVEDYADLRSAIADALMRQHYACETVSSDEAIAKLRKNHYQTILLAPTLPITEDPVMRFIRVEQPDQIGHVILMTSPATGGDPGEERYRSLVKPFNSDELMAQIRAAEH